LEVRYFNYKKKVICFVGGHGNLGGIGHGSRGSNSYHLTKRREMGIRRESFSREHLNHSSQH
jgi:hypothetical protein